MPALIELHHISKSYQVGEVTQDILKDINLTVSTNELVAVMGASGSGKTTLLNIIGLLDTPSTGDYILNGKPVTTLNDDERALARNQMIGFVFQSFYLLPRLTILENVGLPLYYRGANDDEIRLRAQDLLTKVGLAQYGDHKPNELSGGQQQRAAIARSLACNPTFVIADEPTGALDSKTGQMIMDLFIDLHQKEKRTIIVVTHDSGIASQCQRTIKIQDGKLVD